MFGAYYVSVKLYDQYLEGPRETQPDIKQLDIDFSNPLNESRDGEAARPAAPAARGKSGSPNADHDKKNKKLKKLKGGSSQDNSDMGSSLMANSSDMTGPGGSNDRV
eukprot:SAG22_NODE_5531_length_998_cov_1.912125_1_plen_107_part_00